MFGSLNGQLAAGVEMDDLGNAVERAAVLAQDVLVLLRAGQLHVHEALAAPEDTRKHPGFRSNVLLSVEVASVKKCIVKGKTINTTPSPTGLIAAFLGGM